MIRCAALVTALVGAACAPVMKTARLSPDEPPSQRELDAKTRVESSPCPRSASLLYPGVGQVCMGETATGFALATLGTAELGLGIGVLTRHDLTFPGALYPLVAAQDLYLLSVADASLELLRARQIPYTPQDSHEEMLQAPFNPRVLAEPLVWGGLVGMLGVDLGVSALQGPLSSGRFGSPPNLFGYTLQPLAGYAAGAGVFALLFEHVALAEESFFRGALQSPLAARYGETKGWIIASLIFGSIHSLNALFLPADQRASYLAVSVPVITLIGAYLGLIYRHFGYSLAPSTALHFWYDFLVSMEDLLLNPQSSSLAGRLLRLP